MSTSILTYLELLYFCVLFKVIINNLVIIRLFYVKHVLQLFQVPTLLFYVVLKLGSLITISPGFHLCSYTYLSCKQCSINIFFSSGSMETYNYYGKCKYGPFPPSKDSCKSSFWVLAINYTKPFHSH